MTRTLLVLLVAAGLPSFASAQRTRLDVSGFPLNFPAPTGADFLAGWIQSGPITYEVDVRSDLLPRTAIISVRCNNPCPAAGPKTMATLQWKRADLGTWNTLTTANVTVESRQMVPGGSNDTWSNNLDWRFLLSWTDDPPGAQTRFNIVFTLTVTVP